MHPTHCLISTQVSVEMLKGDVVDQYAEEFVPLLKQSHVKVCREEPRPCFYNGERMNALAILRRVFPDVAATAEPLFVALLPDRDAHLMAEILHWQLLERARPQIALGVWRDALVSGVIRKLPNGRYMPAPGAFGWLSSVLGPSYTFEALRKAKRGAKLGERSYIRDDGMYVITESDLKQTVGAVSEVRGSRVPCHGPGNGQPCRCGEGGVAIKRPAQVVVFAADASFEARQAVALGTLAAGLWAGVYCINCARARSEGDDTAVPVNVTKGRCRGLDGEPCENGPDGTPSMTTSCLVLDATNDTDAARELAARAAKDRKAQGFGCAACASKLAKREQSSGRPNAFAANLETGKPCRRGDGEFVFDFRDVDDFATDKLFTEIEGTGCTHSRDEIEKNLTDWKVRIYKPPRHAIEITFRPPSGAVFVVAAAAAALYVQKYDPATSGARPLPETQLARDIIPGMSLNVDRLANNGVVRIDTLGKLAAVDVNNVALLEALKPKETSRIYYSRNALWKMKFGAHDLLGLLPALAEKPPPLPPGLSSGTKQKKRPAAARDQMASDEESPKSKKQRAAPSSSTPESVRAARIQRFDPPPNQSVRVEVRQEVRGAGSAQVPLEIVEIVEVD